MPRELLLAHVKNNLMGEWYNFCQQQFLSTTFFLPATIVVNDNFCQRQFFANDNFCQTTVFVDDNIWPTTVFVTDNFCQQQTLDSPSPPPSLTSHLAHDDKKKQGTRDTTRLSPPPLRLNNYEGQNTTQTPN